MIEADGSQVRANFHTGQGTSHCTVVHVSNPSGASSSKTLGEIKLLVQSQTGQETLRGLCKLHGKSCQCWVNSPAHLDLVLQWLGSGHTMDAVQHASASLELRRSIGMKVRGSSSK